MVMRVVLDGSGFRSVDCCRYVIIKSALQEPGVQVETNSIRVVLGSGLRQHVQMIRTNMDGEEGAEVRNFSKTNLFQTFFSFLSLANYKSDN